MMAIAALAGLWLLQRELERSGLPENAVEVGMFGVIGGIVGAKLLWVAEHWGEEPFMDLLASRGGMSWFGGFAGGVLVGLFVIRRRRLPVMAVLSAAAPALAVGHAIGRIGCFLVGDDYGRPSDLPWAVAFPEGYPPTTVPVHPTQLYEAIALVPIALLLRRLRRGGSRTAPTRDNDRVVFGTYLVLTGLLRFLVEFVRVNVRIVGPLTVAHLASLAAVAVGVMLLLTRERRTTVTKAR
jgi:phosphatidylglycerol---prolipoprotein diacylglyceryl transferase